MYKINNCQMFLADIALHCLKQEQKEKAKGIVVEDYSLKTEDEQKQIQEKIAKFFKESREENLKDLPKFDEVEAIFIDKIHTGFIAKIHYKDELNKPVFEIREIPKSSLVIPSFKEYIKRNGMKLR